jgi:hypothetical protein
MIWLLLVVYGSGALVAWWWLDEPFSLRGLLVVLSVWWTMPLVVAVLFVIVKIHNAFAWAREKW